MFNPKVPNNNMSKLPFEFDYKDFDLLILLNSVTKSLADLNWECKNIPNSSILLDFISIKEWIQSNAIEQIHTTIKDAYVAENLEEKYIKPEDKETINYKKAIIFWFNKVKENRGMLRLQDIIKINSIIIWNNWWIFSSPDKVITKWEGINKEVIYTPPQWKELIKDLLINFLDNYNTFDKEKEIDPLLKLPMLHYQFEAIHPFWDWNWRTWRVLMILFLVIHSRLEEPVLFLSEVINQFKTSYYKHLQRLDKNKSPEIIKAFINFILTWIEIQANRTQILIMNIDNLRIKIKKQLRDEEQINFYSRELMNTLFSSPIYSIKNFSKKMGIAINTSRRYLSELEKLWVMQSFKYKKHKFYLFTEFLKILEKKEEYDYEKLLS